MTEASKLTKRVKGYLAAVRTNDPIARELLQECVTVLASREGQGGDAEVLMRYMGKEPLLAKGHFDGGDFVATIVADRQSVSAILPPPQGKRVDQCLRVIRNNSAEDVDKYEREQRIAREEKT